MALLNTAERYGALTKALHWIIAGLFAFQLGSAWIMVRLQDGGSLAGILEGNGLTWNDLPPGNYGLYVPGVGAPFSGAVSPSAASTGPGARRRHAWTRRLVRSDSPSPRSCPR